MIDDMAVHSERIIVPGAGPCSRDCLKDSRLVAINKGDAS